MPLPLVSPSLWLNADWEQLQITPDANIFNLFEDHPAKSLCCTTEAIEKFVHRPNVDPKLSGERLRSVLGKLTIRRTLSSRVPFDSPKCIGADIPPQQRKVISLTIPTL
jgi:hypothetical protein